MSDDAVPQDHIISINPDEPLKPRYRRVAELAAQGMTNNEICAEVGYTPGRVSLILSHPLIKQEISRLQDRIYEQTIDKRLKDMANDALGVVEKCLTDRTGKFKERDKLESARWIIEKIDGKAVQKHEVSGGLLLGMMDKLDNMKNAGFSSLTSEKLPQIASSGSEIIDLEVKEPESEEEIREKRLKSWVDSL